MTDHLTGLVDDLQHQAAQVPDVYLAVFLFAALLVAALTVGAIAEQLGRRGGDHR